MRKYDFTVIGSVCSVQLLKVHNFPIVGQSETVLNTDCFNYDFGGCSYNIFSGLAKLGAKIYPVMSSTSPSCTDGLFKECESYGFPTDAVLPHNDRNFYHCIMIQDDNGSHLTLSCFCGEDATVGQSPGLSQLKDSYFSDSDYVLIAVGDPRYMDIIERSRRFGTKLVYSYRNDPILAPLEMIKELFYASSFIFTNQIEAEYVERSLGLAKITDLFQRGTAEVIVTTLGKDGCVVYEKDGDTYRQRIVPVTPTSAERPDTVGAGDGFVSGFMAGWIRGEPADVCAQYGNTVSSFVIEKEGAVTNLPNFQKMLERNRTRPDATA